MKMHEIKASWRLPTPTVQNRWNLGIEPPTVVIVEGARLSDPFAEVMRFALTGDGTFLLGDAHTVLHRDIGLAGSACGYGQVLTIGVVLRPEGSWVCMTQPFDTVPKTLFPRLSTWMELLDGEVVELRNGRRALQSPGPAPKDGHS